MKGLCKIQLIDNDTGKIVQETQDENMVTDALNRVLNPPPIFFAESNSADYYNYIHNFMKSIDQTLGGVMLWSEQIPEDVNTIYPPNPNAQVGYAGNDAYTGDNTFRGSYNALESGKTDTGYKFVWDFPTSQANGTIRCVTLTSGRGGRCGWGGAHESIFEVLVGKMVDIPDSIYGMGDYVFPGHFVGMYEDNIFTFAKRIKNNELELRNIELPVYNFKTKTSEMFTNSVNRNYINNKPIKLTSDFNLNYEHSFFRCNDFFVSCMTNNFIDIEYVKFNGKTKSIVTQKKITLTNGRKSAGINNSSEQLYAELNGFLYIVSQDYKTLYKIDINNPANIKDIIIPPYDKNAVHLFVFNGQVVFGNDCGNDSRQKSWFINNENELVPTRFFNIAHSYYWSGTIDSRYIKQPFCLINYNYSNTCAIYPVLITPYIATIDNLASPVTKTASQSMKVIYTLTDV